MSGETGRSESRGREAYQSSGRGGAGNIRRTSNSKDPIRGPDEFSPTRGRELVVDATKVYSSGRGGAGNIRSPSSGPTIAVNQADASYEREVLQRQIESEKTAIHSSGRGGAGNISRSRSRGPNPALASPPAHSTGRGGAGNIATGDAYRVNAIDEEERREHVHPEGIHSTGRGGSGNITEDRSPPIEHHRTLSPGPQSTGRGGVGNIVNRADTRSRSPGAALHSTGRGGAGNIRSGDTDAADAADYEERKQHSQPAGIHSTGRGGAGNLTDIPNAPIEHHGHQTGGKESSGRGGAGNIHGDQLPGLLSKTHIRD